MHKRFLIIIPALLILAPLFVYAMSKAPQGEPQKANSVSDVEIPEVNINYKKYTLDNGLTLIVHEDHSTPVVAINTWYHVGSKNEGPKQHGFAHLFEHLMFQGTEHWHGEYFEPFEQAGATQMNGTTNADRTNYYATVPTPALDRALWMESDRMGHFLGAITRDVMDEQVGVVINEKHQRANQPYGRVWNEIPKATYPEGHPYSWPTIGSEKALKAASLDDVKQWFKTYYGPNNAVLVLSGDITPEKALKKVKHYFGSIPAGPDITQQTAWPAPMDGIHRMTMIDDVPQPKLYMIWNAPASGTPEAERLEMVADVLAGGKASPFYKNLVYKKEIALDVSADVWDRELGSQFIITATPKPGVSLETLEAGINTLLERFNEKPVSQDSLDTSKTRIAASFLHGLDNVHAKSQVLASGEVFFNNPAHYKQQLNAIKQATPKAIQESAKKWLNDNRLVLQVKPKPHYKTQADHVDRSQLPDVGQAPELKLPKVTRFRLDNGLKVELAERHNTPTAQFQLVFDAGYAADPKALPGLADMTLNMLTEGTQEYNSLELDTALDSIGADISAGSSLDSSFVSLTAIQGGYQPALKLLTQVIAHPSFPQRALKRKKREALATIKSEKSTPLRLAMRQITPLLYGKDHAYSQPLTGTGTQASITGMQMNDLASFKNHWLRPDNATLVIVGDVDEDQIKPILDKSLGQWQVDDQIEPKQKNITAVAPRSQARILLVPKRDLTQTTIMAGELIPALNGSGQVGIKVVNQVLGGLFNSRLNLNLREDKHWSYGAGSTIIKTQGQQPFLAYTTVQADKTLPAIEQMRDEFSAITGNRPVSQKELDFAVADLTRSLPGHNETNSQVANSLAERVIFDLPDDYYAQFIDKANHLQTNALPAAAKELLKSEAMSWVIVGTPKVLKKVEAAADWAQVRWANQQ